MMSSWCGDFYRSSAPFLSALALVATAAIGGALAQSADTATKSELPSSVGGSNREAGGDAQEQDATSAVKNLARPDASLPKKGSAHEVAASFDLTSVERLRIRGWGYADLTGEYIIDTATNTISVPGVGRVRIVNMTPAVLEDYLSKFLSKSLRREVGASVEVARFRPFFITGQVSEPSAMEWQPNLTVIKAVALARGVRRDPTEGAAVARPQQTKVQLMFALSQLVRLEAELEFLGGGSMHRGNIPAVATLASLLDGVSADTKSTVKAFMERQEAYLEEQRSLVAGQIAGLETERAAAQQELKAAQSQERAIMDQVSITRELVGNLESLRKNNIVSNPSYLERRSALIGNQVRHFESQALLERARARVEAIGRQITAITQERRALVYDRIATLEREIAQLEVRADEAPGMPELEFQIVRKSAKATEIITGRLDTEVLPGDVVIVSSGDRRTARPQPGLANTRAAGESDVFDTVQRTIEASAATRGRSDARQSDQGRNN